MNFEQELRARLLDKPILLMTHMVLGYPSLEVNRQVIAQMAANGVDCIELQIPFSEPIADGPVILRASQHSLQQGITIEQCFQFAEEMVQAYPHVCFLFMTYYNIVYKYGEQRFLQRCQRIGMRGNIIPDLPPEEAGGFLSISREYGLAPIQFFTPTSSDERLQTVATHGEGFVYCVARRGVTGAHTQFDQDLASYLQRCRRATKLPLAVGFGISGKADVAMLTGKADMAVIGTATIKVVDQLGPEAVGPFLRELLA